MFGLLNSASAISAAFFIDCAASPTLPGAVNGKMSATLTCPVPIVGGGSAAAVGWGGGFVAEMPEQAARANVAAASKTPRHVHHPHDADADTCACDGPDIAGLPD